MRIIAFLVACLIMPCLLSACSGSADASAARSVSPAGVPGPPAPEVDPAVRAKRDNFLADEGKIRPEWLEQGFTLRVTDETGLAGTDGPLYLMCNYNDMAPADPMWQLTEQADGTWQIFIPEQNSAEQLLFFITRGSVETAHAPPVGDPLTPARFGFIEHQYYDQGQPHMRPIIITRWRDQL